MFILEMIFKLILVCLGLYVAFQVIVVVGSIVTGVFESGDGFFPILVGVLVSTFIIQRLLHLKKG